MLIRRPVVSVYYGVEGELFDSNKAKPLQEPHSMLRSTQWVSDCRAACVPCCHTVSLETISNWMYCSFFFRFYFVEEGGRGGCLQTISNFMHSFEAKCLVWVLTVYFAMNVAVVSLVFWL